MAFVLGFCYFPLLFFMFKRCHFRGMQLLVSNILSTTNCTLYLPIQETGTKFISAWYYSMSNLR